MSEIRLGCIAVIFLILFAIAGLGIKLIGTAAGWFGEAAVVAREEFGPREMLRKYEWFKDASAALDSKLANIEQYESRLVGLEDAYKDEPRSAWSRDDRQQHSVWSSELSGVAASYNDLASEYNAQMAKFNWKFTNAGDLPQGADRPVPREYKSYLYGASR